MSGTIFLIGLMGAGKSKVGPLLADNLGLEFVDTDSVVERRADRSITEIFKDLGEQAFRTLESEALGEAAGWTDAVVACGGGAVMDPANAKLIRESGKVIYLKVDPKTALARIRDATNRPLLREGDPLTGLAELLEQREAVYLESADLVVDANLRPEEVVANILEELGL